jgi:mannose-6-phosphate isomerase-like protein (cupin superfamily)
MSAFGRPLADIWARPSLERHMNYEAINFGKKFALFDENWQPKVIAEMNDYQFKIVKLEGDFIWHDHKNTDETFIVLEGTLRIDFRDGAAHISAGEMFVSQRALSTSLMQSIRLSCC